MTRIKKVLTVLLGMLFLFGYSQENSNIDSLIKRLENQSEDTSKIRLLNDLSFFYLNRDPSKGLSYAQEGLKLANKLDNKFFTGISYNNIGLCYTSKGDYEKAIENFIYSLKLKEQAGNKTELSTTYRNLSSVFRKQENYAKALFYLNKALELDKETENQKSTASTLTNIGNIYFSTQKFDSAITYYTKSLEIFEKLSLKEEEATCLNNIGGIFYYQNKLEGAIKYFEKSLKIREETGNKSGMATGMNNIGEVYREKGDYEKAADYFNMSVALAKKADAQDILESVYSNLSDLYEKINDYKKSLSFHKLRLAVRDTLFNIESEKKTQELTVKYETEKKEQENKLLRTEGEKQRAINIGVTIGMALFLVLALAIYRGYRIKQKANRILARQKQIIEEKNKDITDSIRYAKRIQQAIIPSEKNFKEYFPQSFVFFRPKDIVSGDFYWIEGINDNILFAAVDCTGHGVPGAFMSIVGNNLLYQSVIEHGRTQPSVILDEMNVGLSEVLKQRREESSVRDGMDIALCSFNKKTLEMQYAGAFNPMYIVRDNQLLEYKADRFPIGVFLGEELLNFTNQKIQLQKGDSVFIFSDGYCDQFGGEEGKKIKQTRLKQILLNINNLNMSEQKSFLESEFEEWKGNTEQIDDVLLMGIKI